MQSVLYEADHEAFRAMVRDFLAKEVVPHHEAWEEAGIVDREVWRKAGEQGLLGMDVPEEFGGGGVKDFRYNADPRRGDQPGRGQRPRLHAAQRRRRAVPDRPGHRRAEAALAARRSSAAR